MVSITIGAKSKIFPMGEYITFRVAITNTQTSNATYNITYECVYYNYESKVWVSNGCESVDLNGSFMICRCSHTTDFTVLTHGETISICTDAAALEVEC